MRELKQSTRQRFVGISFDYPTSSVEAEIVSKESGVDIKLAQGLVSLATKIRALQELSLLETASTRLLVAAGKLILQGLPPRLACKSAIVEPLTDDQDARKALFSIVELSI